MNKFLTFPGLQPVYLGDIDFLQEAVRDTFFQLLSGLTGQSSPNCILKKATALEDGVICLDGEIMPYKAYTGNLSGAVSYKVKTSLSGARYFKNGETHECYEERYAQEVLSPVLFKLPTLDELLREKITTFSGIANASEEVRYRVSRLANRVDYEVTITLTSETTTEYLCADIALNFVDSSSTTIAQSPKYCSAVVETGDTLSTLPAKIILSADDASATVNMAVKINRTTFAAGSKVTFNFTVIK